MKRIIAMLLAAIMVMGLMAACGGQSGAPAAPAETAAPETEAPKDLAALVSADTNDLLLYVDGAGVFFLDKGTTTTLLVLWMATILQPERFADIDMVEEVKYYYSEFYEFDLTDEQAQNVIDGWVVDD